MPRAADRYSLSILLTPDQRAALATLAGEHGMSEYVRSLIRADADKRNIIFPVNVHTANSPTGRKED